MSQPPQATPPSLFDVVEIREVGLEYACVLIAADWRLLAAPVTFDRQQSTQTVRYVLGRIGQRAPVADVTPAPAEAEAAGGQDAPVATLTGGVTAEELAALFALFLSIGRPMHGQPEDMAAALAGDAFRLAQTFLAVADQRRQPVAGGPVAVAVADAQPAGADAPGGRQREQGMVATLASMRQNEAHFSAAAADLLGDGHQEGGHGADAGGEEPGAQTDEEHDPTMFM